MDSLPYGFKLNSYHISEFKGSASNPKVKDAPGSVIELFARYFEGIDQMTDTANVMFPCPFHRDDTPSCSVNVAKGVFKCHASSCNAQGSAVDLFRRMEGIPYTEAKKALKHLDLGTDGYVELAEEFLRTKLAPLFIENRHVVARVLEGVDEDQNGLLIHVPLASTAKAEADLAPILGKGPAAMLQTVIGDELPLGILEKIAREGILALAGGLPDTEELVKLGTGIHIRNWGPRNDGHALLVDGRDLLVWDDSRGVVEDTEESALFDDVADLLAPMLSREPVKTFREGSNWRQVTEYPHARTFIPVGATRDTWYPWSERTPPHIKTPAALLKRLVDMLSTGWVWTDATDPLLVALFTLYAPIYTAWDTPPLQMHVTGPSQCLDKDTHIRFTAWHQDGRRADHKGGTIERLYERFHGAYLASGRGRRASVKTANYRYTASCMGPGGRIFQNEIMDVVQSGSKPCFQVKTAGGLTITASADHKFWTGASYVALKDLLVGDTVMVHTNVRPKKAQRRRPVTRKYLYVHNHPVAGRKTVRPNGKAYTYHRLCRSRAVVEAGLNGLALDDYVEILNSMSSTEMISCGMIFLGREEHVHHLDENPRNDSPENLTVMLREDHYSHHLADHYDQDFRPKAIPDTITSITPVGERMTYDISMRSPHNNFVADGFVVHNSGKSALACGWFGGKLSGSVQMAPGMCYLHDATAAGIRQEFNFKRRGIILDELLDSSSPRAMDVVEMMRGMETNQGTKSLRGTREGKSRPYDISAPVVWSSISAGGLTQDVNRRIAIEFRRVTDPVPMEPWRAIGQKWSIEELKQTARAVAELLIPHLADLKIRTEAVQAHIRNSPSGGFRTLNRILPLIAIADLCGQDITRLFRGVTAKVEDIESMLSGTEPREEMRYALLFTKIPNGDGQGSGYMTLAGAIERDVAIESPEYGVFYDPDTGTIGINSTAFVKAARIHNYSGITLGRLLKDMPGYDKQDRQKTEGAYVRVSRFRADELVGDLTEVVE